MRYRFGAFELDPASGELRRDGAVVRLQPQPLKVLTLLVERAPALVTRDELRAALWGADTYVDFDRGLNFCISQARSALEDSVDSPRFIQTLPRRGYRFVAPLEKDTGRDFSEIATPDASHPVSARPTMSWTSIAAMLALAAAVIAAALFVGARLRPSTAPSPARTVVAVLPLEDVSPDPSTWFADGLTDELIGQLGRVSPGRLSVIARTSAMAYRNTGQSIANVGRELGVSHIVEGTVRRDGSRVRISVRLVDAASQAARWSDTFDGETSAALALQGEIAASVTRALSLELLPAAASQRQDLTATANLDARDAYLRGRYFMNRGTVGDLERALEHFEAARQADPAFAGAHAETAAALHLLVMFGGMSPRPAYERAEAAAQEAIRLAPDLASAHAALGAVQLWSHWDPSAAAARFERALSLNPSDAAAHHDYAWSLVVLQRFDGAIEHITRARDLDPLSPRAASDVGWLHLQLRQPSEAVRACRHTLAIAPASLEAQMCLERAYLQLGEHEQALAAARAGLERTGATVPAALQPAAGAADSLRAIWRWRLAEIARAGNLRPISPYTLAAHHALAGETNAALAALERAVAERDPQVVLLAGDPVFDTVRAEARFVQLLRTRSR
jgi:TolB-like protein/DNA-binding winged helix-turn-helix (wHTH) protein